ncbi:hypothetical protein [Segetibacter koreensis]|uniref:hypothetical protein n=1 Tax=Segetibacter koreensis TaxID=398037 RepID=UPI00035DEFEA|nr:hypothetical protein [Segetibacter koreensis]
MKPSIIILSVFMTAFQINRAVAQTTSPSEKNRKATIRPMANEGDTVWVIVNHIKADKRKQFERFIHEIFWPMAKKLSPDEQRIFKQTRVLNPLRPEQDGTFNYLFIMDPVISSADYGIENLIKKMYDDQKADEYIKMYHETIASEQVFYEVVQSNY